MIEWVGAYHFTRGRGGCAVDMVVPHIAECPTMAGVDATFSGGGREASAHYCVDEQGIHQYVAEGDTAWAVGDWDRNCRTISIEHVGTTESPPSRAVLDRSAALMADIAQRHGWARLVLGENVGLHKWYSATTCPATLDVGYLVKKANEILEGDDMKPIEVWAEGSGVAGMNFGGLLQDSYIGINETRAQVAALSEAVRVLAGAQGADPDAVARAVSEAVAAKLATIRLEVSTGE